MKILKLFLLILCFCFIFIATSGCYNQTEVKLCDYRNINIPQEILDISNEDVNTSIRIQLLEKNITVDKLFNQTIIEDSDIVYISVSIDNEKSENITLTIGDDDFVQDFDKFLLGKELHKCYTTEINGHSYSVEILQISILAEELSDEIAVKYFDSISAAQVFEETKQEILEHRIFDYIYLYILNNSYLRLESEERNSYINRVLTIKSNIAKEENSNLEEYIKSEYGMSINEYKESVGTFFDEYCILRTLMETESVSISEHDYYDLVNVLSIENELSQDEVIEFYTDEVIRYSIFYDKCYDLILSFVGY